MCGNIKAIQPFEKVFRHFQSRFSRTVNRKAYGVGPRIENAVFSGHIVFKFQKDLAVFQLINILCFAFINKLHCFDFYGSQNTKIPLIDRDLPIYFRT